jgi:hypothetical protein
LAQLSKIFCSIFSSVAGISEKERGIRKKKNFVSTTLNFVAWVSQVNKFYVIRKIIMSFLQGYCKYSTIFACAFWLPSLPLFCLEKPQPWISTILISGHAAQKHSQGEI